MHPAVIILLSILGLFVILNLGMRFRGLTRRGKPVPDIGGALGKSLAERETTIAYFFTPACGACRTQERYWPEVRQRFSNIISIDASRNYEAARSFGVLGTPTIVVIQNGVIKDYFVGVTPPAKIFKALDLAE